MLYSVHHCISASQEINFELSSMKSVKPFLFAAIETVSEMKSFFFLNCKNCSFELKWFFGLWMFEIRYLAIQFLWSNCLMPFKYSNSSELDSKWSEQYGTYPRSIQCYMWKLHKQARKREIQRQLVADAEEKGEFHCRKKAIPFVLSPFTSA